MKAPDSVRWIVVADLAGRPRLRATCRQLRPGGKCREPVDHLCDRCGKPVCRRDIGPLAGDPPWKPNAVEACATCRALEQHYGLDLRAITLEQRRAYLTSSAAAGYAGHHEAETYPDQPDWPPKPS